MSGKEESLIFLLLLQSLLLFGGTLVSAQNTNEEGSQGTNGLKPSSSVALTSCPEKCECTAPLISSLSTPHEELPLLDPASFPTVTCSSRNLTIIPDGIPASVKKLDLSRNNISWVDPEKLEDLRNLQEFSLSSNLIEEISESAFQSLGNLKELTLSRNLLTVFPTSSIPDRVELLNLDHNRISRLEDHILPRKSKIHALLLAHNLIEEIDDEAFDGLPLLQLLDLEGNRLSQVPRGLKKLPNLQELSLANNRITHIDIPFHQVIPRATFLQVRGNPIHYVHPEAFSHLRHLKKLILSDVKNLTEFPNLSGTTSVEILRIDRCSISSIPEDLCKFATKLKNLDLKSNKLENIPLLDRCAELRILELSLNKIQDVGEGAFQNLSELHDLHLHNNRLTKLNPATFSGLLNLRNLDLSYNSINYIHPDTFLQTPKLEDLNLGNNLFSEMPTKGLDKVAELKTFNNPNLKEFPGPASFPNVRRLVLSYAYHCCQFVAAGYPSPNPKPFFDHSPIEETVVYPDDHGFKNALAELNLTDSWSGIMNLSNKAELTADFWEISGASFPTGTPSGEGSVGESIFTRLRPFRPGDVSCIPLPGPFLPCNDLFDWWTLRCGVWIVFLLALMGNGTVVFVQIFARTKMDVPRFLVCNLAIADFFMGIYLGFLAVIDAATLGEFRKFAIPWQLSSACQVAGFLGVLSSELSVFTLTVITLERHYVITHAMHLNKRLSLKHASYIMVGGWIFALMMAILPLFGVSDYRKFAVCLPFETGDTISLGYVVFLMFANGVAFTILMSCYARMYCSIRGSAAWNSNETRIAKNMALLVFTDLLCWFPIAFFSLTAAFGLQLVSLEEAKVFTVFVLPLNSCCNPFLYAILTKQFKKDCVLICKAIEESRVTRGIGRCRHSSNFSNRQTAPNTGSLTDKVSKDGQPCICNSGLHSGVEDVNGNSKFRFIPTQERLTRLGPFGRFISRYILCQNDKESCRRRQDREDPRMQNVRRYLYNTATQNYPPDGQKHQRHPSVSSDNFSSSRSDSWRVQNRCGIPLRLLEPRRRNSWAVTRKPSQDSNLSSSRNDSSATSNSTATWRLSRSSVSSDANSHSGGGKSSFKKIHSSGAATGNANRANVLSNVNHSKILPPPGFPVSSTPGPSGSSPLTNANLQRAPSYHNHHLSINPSVINEESGVIESESPSQVSQNSNSQRRSSCTKAVSLAEPLVIMKKRRKKKKGSKRKRKSEKEKIEAEVILVDDDEASAKIATNRPRLVRQSAFFSDEVIIEPEICPVHLCPLNPGTYDDEDEDDEPVSDECDDEEEGSEEEDEEVDKGEEGEEESDGENSSPTDPILRKPQNQIGIAFVIVPRRLSTISSRDTLSIRSRDENDQLVTDCGFPCGKANNNIDPLSTSSSAGPSGSRYVPTPSTSGTTALLLPASFARRKMSEQPVQFFVVPASSGLLNRAKWHSMSSVEAANQLGDSSSSQLPVQQQQVMMISSSPTQSRPHSRSQSPRGLKKHTRQDDTRMSSMTENQEETHLLQEEDIPMLESVTNNSSSSKNFGFRDPNERRVSFQLPAVTVVTMPEENEEQVESEENKHKSSDV